MKRGAVSSKKKRRSYDNSLREEQARLTRSRILEGLEALLDEGSVDDLSVPAVSERTGVSVATIYRHFPNREALIEGLIAWIRDKAGHAHTPLTLEDLSAGAPDRFRYFARYSDEIRLGKQLQSWKAVREYGQASRDREIAEVLAPLTGDLEPERARALHGVFRMLFGFDLYAVLADRFDVDETATSEAVGFVARAAIRALEDERREKRKKGKRS